MENYKLKDNDIALLAPTGRAAKKMMETTCMPAFTIHKYLGWDKDNLSNSNTNDHNTQMLILIESLS